MLKAKDHIKPGDKGDTRELLKKAVSLFSIDTEQGDNGMLASWDQMYSSYPLIFPCVTFFLQDSNELEMLARESEEDEDNGNRDEDEEPAVSYSFSIGVYLIEEKARIDNCIEFEAERDTVTVYGFIPLSEEEQYTVLQKLEDLTMDTYGKNLHEILQEAEKNMGIE